MKTKLLPLICVLFLTTMSLQAQSSTAPAPPVWKTYTVRGEAFSVALPLLPAVDIKIRYVTGNLTRKEVLVGAYADGVAFAVYAVENSRSRQSLDDFIKEQLGDAATYTDEGNLSRDGLSGKQFLISERSVRLQFFAGNDRLYMVRGMAVLPDDPRVKQFFDSLKFGKAAADAIEAEDGPGAPFEPVAEATGIEDPTTQKLLTGKEVDRKIRLAMKPEPIYTERARLAQVTGTVVLKAVFNRHGNVTNIRVVSGLPNGLTENAIDSAKKIKFLPAIKDGKFVSMWIQLEYNFNLY